MSDLPRTFDHDAPAVPAPGWRRIVAVARPGLVWHPRDHKTGFLVGVLAVPAMLLAGGIYAVVVHLLLRQGAAFVNAWFLFWGWSDFIHLIAPASRIYDPHALYVFERGLVGAHPKDLPFAYPPSLLLLIWPLALLRPVAAWAVWTGFGLVLYVAACWQRRGGAWVAFLALVAPATVAAVFYAQTSLIVAALMLGGWRLIGRRPILAGVLLGLIAFKPQFGLLIPVALIAARQWRSVLAASATVALSVFASGLAFGWASWTRLPAALAGLSRLIARHPLLDHLAPTVTGAMRQLGAGPLPTDLLQLGAAAVTALAVWISFRRGPTPLAVATLLVGAFFVTPYAFLYDLPLVNCAVLAVVIERHRSADGFGAWEMLILILAVALPVLMVFNPLDAPWGMIVLPMLVAMILRRQLVVRNRRIAVAA